MYLRPFRYKLQALLRIFAWLPDLDRGDPIEEAKLEVQVSSVLFVDGYVH